jgi:predicted O-linked N-acetylglucosamine transferase (SPINDLY family)
MTSSPAFIKEIDGLINKGDVLGAKNKLLPLVKSGNKDAWAHFAMGTVLLLEDDLDNAEYYLNQSINLDPKMVYAYTNLAVVYDRKKEPVEKIESLLQAVLQHDAKHYEALLNLTKLYIQQGSSVQAYSCFNRLSSLVPKNSNDCGQYLSCAFLLRSHHPLIEYIEKLQEGRISIASLGVGLFPLFASMRMYCFWSAAKNAMDVVLNSLESPWSTLDLVPFMEVNMMVLAMPEMNSAQLSQLHRLAAKVAKREVRGGAYTEYPLAMQTSRRWRIGIFSPDYRKHIMDFYLRGIITEHNRRFFEIICYSNTKVSDNVTEDYRLQADRFVEVLALSDVELAQRIHSDGIHIMVYATMYTVGGRSEVVFYKPAPVQMMYLGYPFTTGIEEMDYFILDHYLDTPENKECFTEKIICLPESYAAVGGYEHQDNIDILPCQKNEYITLGTLIQPYKMNEDVIAVWSQIMHRLAGSKFIFNHPAYETQAIIENISQEFLKHGIERDRLLFIWDKHPSGSHLYYYHQIDLSLDTFPTTGGATSYDALWMGVPVVTQVGKLYHQRVTYSMLKNVGIPLDDLIAFSEEEYVQKAISLAKDVRRLAMLRQAIPRALKGSTLSDPLRLTRHMEEIFLEAWDSKYATRPVEMDVLKSTAVHRLSQENQAIFMVTERSLDDIYHYVLEEQNAWYEMEWHFLQCIIQPGARYLDIGAEIGHYAIPLAHAVGEKGRVWAVVHCPHEAALIEASKAYQPTIPLDIIGQGDRQLRLDAVRQEKDIQHVDVVRIQARYAHDQLWRDGKAFFEEENPLIMIELTQTSEGLYDWRFISHFEAKGYKFFRVLPGLQLLVPFTNQAECDAFSRSIFACKEERIKQLLVQGVLIEAIPAAVQVPEESCEDWRDWMERSEYGAQYISEWSASAHRYVHRAAYEAALNLYVQAYYGHQPLDQRVAGLLAAMTILIRLTQEEFRLPRAVTLIRILMDIGKREEAVELLTAIAGALDASVPIVMDEPFISLSVKLPEVGQENGWATQASLGRAVFADMLFQREQLRSFSSWFTGAESLEVLQAIEAAGLGNAALQRREQLIRERFLGEA